MGGALFFWNDPSHWHIAQGLKRGAAMPALVASVPRTFAHDEGGARILENSTVSFRHRIFGKFDLDLKAVKLTQPLMQISQDCNMFTRSHIPEECYNALRKLGQIRECDRLQAAKSTRLFPLVPEVIALEKRFGGFVSDEDIDGGDMLAKTRKSSTKTAAQAVRFTQNEGGATSAATSGAAAAAATTDDGASESDDEGMEGATRKHASDRRKAPTDTHNEAYLAAKREEAAAGITDFLAAHVTKYTTKFRKDRPRGPVPESGIIHPYSGQRLGYNDFLLQDMRERKGFGFDADKTHAYSAEYLSSTFAVVDEKKEARDQMTQTLSKMRTSTGFLRTSTDPTASLMYLPKPDVARRDELTLPWIENEFNANKLPVKKVLRSDVEAFTAKGLKLFTGNAGPCAEFGDPGNSDWGKSVHLPSDTVELTATEKMALKAEEAKKIRVADPVFRQHLAGYYRQVPTQTDRYESLLHGPPMKSGVKYPPKLMPQPAPPTMFNDEFVISQKEMTDTFMVRKADKTKFHGDGDVLIPGRARVLWEKKGAYFNATGGSKPIPALQPQDYQSKLFRASSQ